MNKTIEISSFRSLPARIRYRTRYTFGPAQIARPVLGKPEHGALEDGGGEITTIGNVVEFGAPVKNQLRDALSPYAAMPGEGISRQKDLISHLHIGVYAVICPHSQETIVLISFRSVREDN